MRGILLSASLILLGMSTVALAQQPSDTTQPARPGAAAPTGSGDAGAAGGPSGPGGAVTVPGQGRIILLAPGEVERLLRAQQGEDAEMTGDEQEGMRTGPDTRPRRPMMMMGDQDREWHHRRMPSGAFFRFKHGEMEVVIKCADSEPTTACVSAASALIDKVESMHPAGAPGGGGTAH